MADQHNPSGSKLLAAAVVAVLVLSVALPFTHKKDSAPVASMSAEDANVRIQPVAKFEVAEAGGADAGKPRDGATIYQSVCSACHSSGALGAPRAGDKAAWGPRIATGKEALYKSALNGKNSMPPRGGAADLSDAEVKSAVDHLVSLAK